MAVGVGIDLTRGDVAASDPRLVLTDHTASACPRPSQAITVAHHRAAPPGRRLQWHCSKHHKPRVTTVTPMVSGRPGAR